MRTWVTFTLLASHDGGMSELNIADQGDDDDVDDFSSPHEDSEDSAEAE